MAKKKKKQNVSKLLASLAIDTVGALPTVLAVVGAAPTAGVTLVMSEGFDIIWSPISGLLIYALYKDKGLAFFGVAEELLPFTDIVPTATIGYIKHYKKN